MNFYNLDYEKFTHIIAIGEKSGGNETVGDMWVITKAFPKETPVVEIIAWAEENSVSGKLTLTISEPEKKPVQF